MELEAAGSYVRTKVTAEDRRGLMIADCWTDVITPGNRERAILFAAAYKLLAACEAAAELIQQDRGECDTLSVIRDAIDHAKGKYAN